MRKGRDGEKKKKNGEKKNGKKTGEKKKKENTNENSGRYVIASSRPPECRPLERHTLVPIFYLMDISAKSRVMNFCPMYHSD